MSGGQACQCSEKREPLAVPEGSNRPPRLWRVAQWRCNHSAFNGYHRTPSRYSSIWCLRCGRHWRTTAPYADSLPHLAEEERNMAPGYDGYAEAMAARGREPYGRDEGSIFA